ncbi:MAG: NADPH:quinone oxidoreductase family protein [Spongiibacteraceae bacterium]
MKAIVCESYGAVNQLKYIDVGDPTPNDNEVVVSVRACGVNFPDALLVQGLYQDRPPLPFIPGIEFTGDIVAVGAKTEGLAIGTRVLGTSSRYGTYAEKIASPANNVIPIPNEMSYEDGANLLCAHGTAHHALKQKARLQAGETLLVLGAAGGTGIAAVQIGKAMGARVIAACSSAEKLAIAKANGADLLINYGEQDLKAALKEITANKGVDVVFDPVGGEAFNVCARSMARNGRLLVVGFASGVIPQLPINLTLVKEFSVVGVFWGSFVRNEPRVFADNMGELFQWYRDKKISVVTDEKLPLAQAAVALQKLIDREVVGKVVLVP